MKNTKYFRLRLNDSKYMKTTWRLPEDSLKTPWWGDPSQNEEYFVTAKEKIQNITENLRQHEQHVCCVSSYFRAVSFSWDQIKSEHTTTKDKLHRDTWVHYLCSVIKTLRPSEWHASQVKSELLKYSRRASVSNSIMIVKFILINIYCFQKVVMLAPLLNQRENITEQVSLATQ